MGYNKLRRIERDTFQKTLNLAMLMLSNNDIEVFPANVVRNLRQMYVIDLTSNQLIDFDEVTIMGNCPFLRYFLIIRNNILCHRFGKIIKNLKSIRYGQYKVENSKVKRGWCMADDEYIRYLLSYANKHLVGIMLKEGQYLSGIDKVMLRDDESLEMIYETFGRNLVNILTAQEDFRIEEETQCSSSGSSTGIWIVVSCVTIIIFFAGFLLWRKTRSIEMAISN